MHLPASLSPYDIPATNAHGARCSILGFLRAQLAFSEKKNVGCVHNWLFEMPACV
jgi:hypothetical protein